MSGPRNAMLRRLQGEPEDGIRIVPALPEHGFEIAQNMRRQDEEEVFASGGYLPHAAVEASLEASTLGAWALIIDERVVAIFGVGPLKASGASDAGPRGGAIWLLCSNHVDRYRNRNRLAKRAPKVLEILINEHHYLSNYIDARYTSALRWASKLGFTIDEARPFGLNGLPFHRIHLKSRKLLAVQEKRIEGGESDLIIKPGSGVIRDAHIVQGVR